MSLKEYISHHKNLLQIRYYLAIYPTQASKIQKEFLTRTLKLAAKHVPYYSQLLNGTDITTDNCVDVLKNLPTTEKKELRNNSSRVAKYVDESWASWHNTGGSTGSPLKFPIGGNPRFSLNGEAFCQAYLYNCMTGSISPHISSVDGRRVSDQAQANNIFWGLDKQNFPYGKVHYSTMYLNKDTFPYYLEKLNNDKPEVLRGYPSGIYELATYILNAHSVLTFIPTAIYLTSENILDYQIELIQQVFQCPVWGQYGHSEASIFAIRKPGESRYSCMPIYGYTEILKEDGTHANVGEIGEIVVTGFQYTAMPFIRYRTGDLAEFGGIENSCVILNKLLGRSNDYILTTDKQRIYLVGFIFGGHLKAFNHIEEWQIIQNEPGSIKVKIIPSISFSKLLEKEIVSFFNSNGFNIEIEYVNTIEHTNRGKRKFLIQNIK